MRLKLDENLGRRGAESLFKAGHDAATVVEQGLGSSSDRALLAVCHDESRCLVTLDLDFANPLLFNPASHPGIAVLRLPPKPTPTHLGLAIETLIFGLRTQPIDGKLWIVEVDRIREYQQEADEAP
jgi:predicted nuclease of predicted toxin-antitoxin system